MYPFFEFSENYVCSWEFCFVFGLILGMITFFRNRNKENKTKKNLTSFAKGLIISYLIGLFLPLLLVGNHFRDIRVFISIIMGLIYYAAGFIILAKIIYLLFPKDLLDK